uniref:Large ribosomal subunit protein uL2m n=1 Tax=Jakoba bahamiensis TaxID=221721 RepID=M4QC55_9EUKA|nr:ribosomal protein L2 [Jakoba bahamiensis]AGH24154.1 ribosomal protein L2 [Jakoba bahamiensis]
MSMKRFNPVTSSMRQTVLLDRSDLWKGKPEKSLSVGVTRISGRNNQGRLSLFHRGGGHKKKYRYISFIRTDRTQGEVLRIEYDPKRSANIALIRNSIGELFYILAVDGIKIGDYLAVGPNVDVRLGNVLPLSNIPIGTTISNVELIPGKGAQFIRSAGSFGQLIQKKSDGYALIRLASGEIRMVLQGCQACIGIVSNPDHKNQVIGKAGRSRWMGRRPIVRGVAMNPVDHPHGGGEGKTSGGRPSVTPWGIPTKGKPTRSVRRKNRYIVQRITGRM